MSIDAERPDSSFPQALEAVAPSSVPTTATSQSDSIRLSMNRLLGLFFGLLGPVICLVVAHGLEADAFIFGGLQLLAEVLIVTEIVLLLAWLARPATTPWFAGVFAGAFYLGACFAGLVGFCMLPLSLVTLSSGVGILGFVPFGTSYVFARVTRDAMKTARVDEAFRRASALALGALLACLPSVVAEGAQSVAANIALRELGANDPAAIDRASTVLRFVPWFDSDRLIPAFEDSVEQDRRARISELYKRREGVSIEDRLAELAD